jgi:predicted  nucleic acid-binding Zn-ribbon protein
MTRKKKTHEDEVLEADRMVELTKERAALMPERADAERDLSKATVNFDAVNKRICEIEADIRELLGFRPEDY